MEERMLRPSRGRGCRIVQEGAARLGLLHLYRWRLPSAIARRKN